MKAHQRVSIALTVSWRRARLWSWPRPLRAYADYPTITVRVASVAGPTGPNAFATATVSCNQDETLVGGGGFAQPPAGSTNPSPLHLNGSFPSDAAGNPVSGTASTAGSWSAAATSGSALGSGTTTSAYAVCTDVAGSVVSTYVGFHGVSGPSTSGAFATATTTPCLHHWGDELISGGALTTAAVGGQNAAPLHLNGSVPSNSPGDPSPMGAPARSRGRGLPRAGRH